MRAIFVSYRREDSEGEAGRLFDDLVGVFGEKSVFMDVAGIEVGRDFRKVIDDSVATCGVLLAIIGKGWIDAKNEAGQRRLDDPSDFVRLETASALKRDIPVVPVLVRGAPMPSSEQLPNDLKELAYRNGVELTHARWSSDVQLLINALRPHVQDLQKAAAAPNQAAAESGLLSPDLTTVEASDARNPLTIPTKRYRALLIFVGAVLTACAVLASLTLRTPASRNPAAGEGATVGRGVSSTPTVEIPSVIGQSLDDARRTLAHRQLQVGSVERQSKAGVSRDRVLEEFPVAGQTIQSGSKIDLMVSSLAENSGVRSGFEIKSRSNEADRVPPLEGTLSTKPPVDEAKSAQPHTTPPAADQPRTTHEETETPMEGAQPSDQVANISGIWHDRTGVTLQATQRGNSFTYTASSPIGVGRGSGTIRGLEFESSYQTIYVNGRRSAGRCTGTVFGDGSMLQADCFDSISGLGHNIFSR